MNIEQASGLARRAAVHAALAEPARLQITDTLLAGDASPSELAALLAMPSNLLAHHLHVLEQAGVITRRRSEGDRRRTYLQLIPGTLDSLAAARRHRLPLPRLRPRHISEVQQDDDLIVTVCDLAREELGRQAAVHWSVPDPVPAGDAASFDSALADLSHRVGYLAPRLAATS